MIKYVCNEIDNISIHDNITCSVGGAITINLLCFEEKLMGALITVFSGNPCLVIACFCGSVCAC